MWNFVTKPHILIHSEGYCIFRFHTIAHRDQVLQSGPYTYRNKPMILKLSEIDFSFNKDILSTIPDWVRFPRLPVGFWSTKALRKMASVVGNPLYTDKYTAHYEKISYTRVLVEVDAAYPLPEHIQIESPYSPMIQMIEYDWKPYNTKSDEEQESKEEGRPRRQRKRTKKQGKTVKQAWLVKKVQVNTEPNPQENLTVQKEHTHGRNSMEKASEIIESPQQNVTLPQTSNGTNPSEINCSNTVMDGNMEKGKAIVDMMDKGRRGQQIDRATRPPNVQNPMIIVTWNVRGLNQAHKQKEVKNFLATNKIDVMGCIETRVKEHKAKKIQGKIEKGWNVCCNYSNAVNGRICIIYAQNDGNQRKKLWRDLRGLTIPSQEAWLLSGDFNNVLSSEDRIGSPVTDAEIKEFKDVIDDLQLTPLSAKGWHYTWTNKQGSDSRVYSKIDWALGNYQWIQQQLMHPKPFRLYTNIMELPQFQNIMQQVWKQHYEGAPMQQIWSKLKNMKEQLKEEREKLDIIQTQIKQNPLSQSLFNEEKITLAEIEKWSNVEEQVMRQKSKACWIECGDANTKYFHAQ
ncbi:PREDICTED: uncharacterized protein LOC109207468 [Nicotiana attenuata]|uniref:uncharacterized protein LOC109207468 n=1 Tax=Nicotiana attenuata TaxID=49451 RepID=UPI0009046A14|nr:PREDICTED: uncharacterized protein LOC109207468 [Nicotiana attenuata]